MTARRWVAIRSITAILIGLFGGFMMFFWFIVPKDIYFWQLSMWPFFVFPVGAGGIASFLYPRSTPGTKRLAKVLSVIYSVVFALFLMSFGIAFAMNNTHRYW